MKTVKKFLSMLLAIMMIISIIPVTSIEAEAASYNASAAVDYANSYWNDGKGLCAEFVSRCLNAGGVTIPNKASYYSSSTQSYKNNSGTLGAYTNPYTCSASLLLYLSEHYTIITNPSSSDIAVGDVVFMYGGSSGQWKDGHVGIVISKTNGVPVYAAHNKATNSGKFSSSYPCTYVAKMNGTTIHTHSYSTYYEAAHPHKVYKKCSCGDWSYTGATKILTSCSSCMVKSTKWPVPLYGYTLNTGKTTVYNAPNGSAKSNKIYDTDLCTITAIYTNGWCKVTFPLDAGGTDSGYVKTSVFLDPSYNVFTMKASAKITAYSRSGLSTSIGYAASGDTVYICDHTSSAVQIAYPLSSGGYKVGWVSNSWFKFTIKYNANGGTGTMSSSTAQYQGGIAVAENKFTKTGHTFNGWNMKRASDSKWYYKNKGWYLPSAVSSSDTKSVYTAGRTYTMDASWIRGGKTKDTITFYATWRANTLSTYFNANGGTINSNTYKLINNLVYNISDGSKYVQKWTYNTTKTNGIVNVGTLGLSKIGYTFSGWGTKSSGGTVFDQDDTGLLPVEINSALKNGDCSTTLYAIWKPNIYTIKYNANGGSGTMSSSSHTYDTAKALTANSFTRTGYTFLGWSTSSSATSPTYTDKQSVKNLTSTNGGTVTLYAVWQKNIVTVTLSSVSVSQKPNKTEYTVGDTLDTSGLKLKLTYSDGSTKEIISGFNISSPDMSTAGTKTVTVIYEGKTTSFNITVKEKETNSASIKVNSTNTSVGQQVTVPIVVENAELGVLTINIGYDSSKLRLVSISGIPFDMYETNTTTAGKIIITAFDNTSVSAGTVTNITFDVIATSDCSTNVIVSVVEAFDGNDKAVELTAYNGIVKINSVLKGDVNGDGKITAIDARWALQNAAGNRDLTDEQKAAGDVNGDGKVSAIDARWILQAVAGNREL